MSQETISYPCSLLSGIIGFGFKLLQVAIDKSHYVIILDQF